MSTTTMTMDAPKMGIFSSSEALAMLWSKVESTLEPHELKWFANGAEEQINIDTSALTEVLMELGSQVASDTEAGSFQSRDSVSNLLFNLSSQLSTINGLAQIASRANYLVNQSLNGQP